MDPSREDFRPLNASGILSWVHFGDLHLTVEHAQNYQDFLALIAAANDHLAGLDGVNFALLPGDNADDGTEAQFLLVRRALDGLHLPVHALPGDHDIQSGNLGLFRRWLEPVLPKSFVAGSYRCVFLNSVEIEGTKGFGLGRYQLTVRAESASVEAGEDAITVWCDQAGRHDPSARSATDSENAIGSYPCKGLLGTQLGPNKNGHSWGPS